MYLTQGHPGLGLLEVNAVLCLPRNSVRVCVCVCLVWLMVTSYRLHDLVIDFAWCNGNNQLIQLFIEAALQKISVKANSHWEIFWCKSSIHLFYT